MILRSLCPTIHPTPPCLLNHILKCHIYTFFEPLQGWGLRHFLGHPIPMPDHSFSKEIFPNIPSKPPLTQIEAIASHAISSYLGEETNTFLTTTSFQVVVESNKFPPQPLLWTKEPQLPQPLPIRLVLQPPPQPRCPALDTLQPLHVLLGVRGPKLNTALEVGPHQHPVQGHHH